MLQNINLSDRINRRDGKYMANFIEFFRMVFSYLFVFAVIIVVSAAGAIAGVKLWKPKQKVEEKTESEA